ncbi:hypothetical protein M0802_008201 [Mischocyttarus mexicanus]|nr:hypothetical protein M0802_008201 [Mischocyttarus mexicanus]
MLAKKSCGASSKQHRKLMTSVPESRYRLAPFQTDSPFPGEQYQTLSNNQSEQLLVINHRYCLPNKSSHKKTTGITTKS